MLCVLCLMQSLYVYGREIKTVNLTENEIYPLKLVLGKTTLLRFSEKPQKIIFGKPSVPAYFCAVQKKSFIKKNTVMSDHIENEGKKGKFMMWFIIYFVLFISLLIYLYRYNLRLEF